MSEKIPVEAYLTKKVIFLSLRILFWCLLKEGWHLKECLYSEFPLFSVRISHLILSKPGSESQGFKHSPCIFPFPVLCQCGCKVVAQPHRPSQKDTSTESAADVFPPGGVCGYSLHVQGQMGSRVTGVVVPPGRAGLGAQPGGQSCLCWLLEGTASVEPLLSIRFSHHHQQI